MVRTRLVTVLPLLTALLFACSSGAGGSDTPVSTDVPDAVVAADTPVADTPLEDAVPADTTVPTSTLAAVTFNAGLAVGFVDNANERLPLIGPAVAKLAADVVCMQEVWNQDSIDAVLAATKDVYPHVNKIETKDEGGGGAAACTTDEVKPLKDCVEANCAGVDPANLATCALGKCGTEFGALPAACSTCIAANIGKPIDEILTACTTASGATYAYEGRNGLLLLSKHAFAVQEYKQFESYLNVRVVLHSRIAVEGFGDVDVYCTHLTADLDDVQYAGKSASWGEEQGAQIDALLAWIDETATAGGATLVLGDLNCGPAKGADVAAEHPENYKKLTDAGFVDPYATSATTPCSWCATNPLVRDDKNMMIDHVLVRNLSSVDKAEAARVLDEPVVLTVGGESVDSRLSDHYGVQVTLPAPVK